jgi:hypothetical protein
MPKSRKNKPRKRIPSSQSSRKRQRKERQKRKTRVLNGLQDELLSKLRKDLNL